MPSASLKSEGLGKVVMNATDSACGLILTVMSGGVHFFLKISGFFDYEPSPAAVLDFFPPEDR